jgi:hypothetical protein
VPYDAKAVEGAQSIGTDFMEEVVGFQAVWRFFSAARNVIWLGTSLVGGDGLG